MRLLFALALVACKSANFVTVQVDGIPCNTSSLDVVVSIEGDETTATTSFSGEDLGDGASNFALDMGDHRGTLDVTVTARVTGGSDVTAFNSVTLPASLLVINLPGPACATGMPDAATDCWIAKPSPTNFAPCAPDFPPPIDPNDYAGTANTIDTDLPPYYTYGGAEMKLQHVTTFTIESGAVVEVQGMRPLLIVADSDVVIQGTIEFRMSSSSGDCMIFDGAAGTPSAPGAAGGAYGTAGGDGGAGGAGRAGPTGPPANGSGDLVPLRSGCEGGAGGSADPSSVGGNGGPAAGAIEISSKTSIMISGAVLANGGGGSTGLADTASGRAGGGGGGASGGSILLETPAMTITGSVCAVGGGGGEGGTPMSATPNGELSTGCVGGKGGDSNLGIGGVGGTGADLGAPLAGTSGLGDASGGGGGGAGRIRIRSNTFVGGGPIAPLPQTQ